MLSNLFFILVFTLILFNYSFFMWLVFFSRFHPLMFNLFRIELHVFFICCGSIQWHDHKFKSWYGKGSFFSLFSFMILSLYIIFLYKNNNFMVIFNLFSISLFYSYNLDHKFCQLFCDRDFFMFCFVFNICVCLYIYICVCVCKSFIL